MSLSLSSAEKIASYAIRGPEPSPASLAVEHSQAVHRINLINAWAPAIGPGTRVLELGCGQGTCTQALAEAVSSPDHPASSGHITAVDPGAPDYGAPFTLAQAQSHLSAGPLGPLLTFHRADPVDFLAANPDAQWDVAVLAHCVWYFRSPDTLRQTLTALRGRVARVCLAEWALHATEPAAVAHVLAALARATFEAHRVDSTENIQMPASPRAIKDVVGQAGWKVESEGTVVPGAELSDGFWETGTVVDEEFAEEVEKEVKEERVKAALTSARDATIAAADSVGGARKTTQVQFEMHCPTLLATFTTLMATALGAPATASHALTARDGPCDASSETCRPVLQANACFAAFIRTGTKEQVLQCVNHQDAALAEEQLCACYGCAETTVQDWATSNLECAAPA
ncbi:uncharacterized protein B0H64DRAFT_474192 [Chaetomium fimeti]|uniref:Methyltransferase domain-containing protein n=1 Tax=Chaetomium fimeti TaxID=1854472 RepID=A0AAE0LRI8_9PEZI|nr:hypothetical protein B0H64DRAFT_474192 [Chaetomium fimeti]